MIGTPNKGTEAAWLDLTNCPFSSSNASGLEDLRAGSAATQVPDNSKTNYYALAGNLSSPCFIVIERAICYTLDTDGFVTTTSAISHYKSLGIFQYSHQNLLKQKDIYEKVKEVLQ